LQCSRWPDVNERTDQPTNKHDRSQYLLRGYNNTNGNLVFARVNPVHVMNVEQHQVTADLDQATLEPQVPPVQAASNPHPPSAFIAFMIVFFHTGYSLITLQNAVKMA